MLPLLILLFVVVPIAELYVIIQVGEAIGALPTIGLLVLDSLLGSWLLRAQGRATWTRFRLALAGGRPPARETIDGALVILGGALMLAPGFITDLFGVLLLLPPTRAVARRVIARNALNRLLGPFGTAGRAAGAASRMRRRQDYDVDATAREIDPPILPR
ncbi:MAG: FxsA family protein [Actinobacteria bacterium]|nr:FxsA family protein [Actinomycetota bacterium]